MKELPTEREMLQKAVFLLQEHKIISTDYQFGNYGLGPYCSDLFDVGTRQFLKLGLELRCKAMSEFAKYLYPKPTEEWTRKRVEELAMGFPLEELDLK